MYGPCVVGPSPERNARSGDRVQIAAYLGKGDVFDQAIADFSVTYAEQNARDYAALQKASRRPGRGRDRRLSAGFPSRRPTRPTSGRMPAWPKITKSTSRHVCRDRARPV